jgi:hypothetical protein
MSNGPGSLLTAQGMAKKINLALDELYKEKHGQSLPEAGKEEREMLFIAISRGILAYLDQEEKNLIDKMTLRWKVGSNHYQRKYDVKDLELNIKP